MAYESQYGGAAPLNGNGYLDMLPTPNYGPSPWENVYAQDQAYATGSLQKGAQNVQAQQAQLSRLQYPTFPNSMGLGSQTAFGGPSAQPQSNSLQINSGASSSAPPADSGSRGFNPWSLHGEANAR